jgi:hypothetical protein
MNDENREESRGSKKVEEGARMAKAQVSRWGWKVRKAELEEGRKGRKQETWKKWGDDIGEDDGMKEQKRKKEAREIRRLEIKRWE